MTTARYRYTLTSPDRSTMIEGSYTHEYAEHAYTQGSAVRAARRLSGWRIDINADRPVVFGTYDVVTEESAEYGDTAEQGWFSPGGYDHPIPPGLHGERVVRFHAFHVAPSWEWDPDDAEADNLRAVADFLRDAGAETHSAPSFYCHAEQNMYTGAWRSECYHLEGFTDDQIAAVVTLVDGEG